MLMQMMTIMMMISEVQVADFPHTTNQTSLRGQPSMKTDIVSVNEPKRKKFKQMVDLTALQHWCCYMTLG